MTEVSNTTMASAGDFTSFWTKDNCEAFLVHEADLLDRWQLREWLSLFTPDAVYEVPITDVDAQPSSSDELFYISDNYARLCARVVRMEDPQCHSEWPRSSTVRMIGNIIVQSADETLARVKSSFVTYRSSGERMDVFPGHHLYELHKRDGDAIKIARKTSFLALQGLRLQGKITIIV